MTSQVIEHSFLKTSMLKPKLLSEVSPYALTSGSSFSLNKIFIGHSGLTSMVVCGYTTDRKIAFKVKWT